MGAMIRTGSHFTPEIMHVVRRLAELLHPSQVYLYNHKMDPAGNSTAFKLCVIVDTENKMELEKRAYLDIDCEIPFDLLLYTPHEWDVISLSADSFASKIMTTGTIVYG